MTKRSSRRQLLIAAGLLPLALTACGGGEERPAEDGPATSGADSSVVAADTPGTADEAPTEAPATQSAGDPFAGFELEAGEAAYAEPRRIALRLVNPGERLAIVYADGGAGAVLLDSVPGRSEARVDLLTRAPVVTLRSMASSGKELRATEVAVGPDTVVGVVVGTRPGG